MNAYQVTWVMDIEADSEEDAARKARAILLDPGSIANVFDVRALTTHAPVIRVDLDEDDESREHEQGEGFICGRCGETYNAHESGCAKHCTRCAGPNDNCTACDEDDEESED